jgi:hypothetical protein
MTPERASRVVWLACDVAALAAGLIGVVVPLLPTTPLVILAAFCFARSSPRLLRMLTGHPRLGPLIAAWNERRVIPRRARMAAYVMMMCALAMSAVLGFGAAVLALQASVMLGAATFIALHADAQTFRWEHMFRRVSGNPQSEGGQSS